MSYPEEPTSPVGPPPATAHLQVDGELAPGTVIGEYNVEARIGAGAMGMVYSALQPVIGKRAAIKVMASRLCVDPVAVERFVQEARAVNQIGHPNIVDVFAFGSLPDGRSYMVMEWLQGETLGARMRRGLVPLAEAIAILFQMCDALAAAHDKNVVHRDLKPENVFLVPVRGRRLMVKLLDFGVAKLRGVVGEGGADHTAEGMSVGTPRYMSPEQARGKDTDHRADIYSLGVTAYELLVGRPPFEGNEALDLMHKHVYQIPPAPSTIKPDLPLVLERMLVQMLEKKPDRRPTLPQVETILVDVRDRVLSRRDLDTGPMGLRAMEETGRRRAAQRDPDETTEVVPAATGAARGASRRRVLVSASVALFAIAVTMLALKLRVRPAAAVVEEPKVHLSPAEPESPPEPAPSTLAVRVNAPDARIELDGKVLASAAHEGRFTVGDEGEHTLDVSAPHFKPTHRAIRLTRGAEVQVDVELERVPVAVVPPRAAPKPAAPKPARTSRTRGDRDYMVDPFAAKK